MGEVYQALIDRWGNSSKTGLTLKTDLYDEAVTKNSLIPLLADISECVIGNDASFNVAEKARKRMIKECNGWQNIVVSDVRKQAFKSDSFDQVVSNSTLDHFFKKSDIIVSLNEIHRVLKPGGTLIITLDNPLNPVIFIRNLMPYRLLKKLGIIPYRMGVTLSKHELIRALESSGFKVCDTVFIDHAPRILVIFIGRFLDKIRKNKIKKRFRRIIKLFETLSKTPVGCVSGYFFAVKAVKVRKER